MEGNAVELPVYDYVNHTRSAEKKHQEPKDVIIIEVCLVCIQKNYAN